MTPSVDAAAMAAAAALPKNPLNHGAFELKRTASVALAVRRNAEQITDGEHLVVLREQLDHVGAGIDSLEPEASVAVATGAREATAVLHVAQPDARLRVRRRVAAPRGAENRAGGDGCDGLSKASG